jgi:hypothetical protein
VTINVPDTGGAPRVATPDRSRRRWLIWAVAGVAIASGGSLVASYGLYREWPWSAYPSALHVCGRDYLPSAGTRSRHQIEAAGESIKKVGTVPGWLNHGDLWGPTAGPPLTTGTRCYFVMWVRTESDTFKEFVLSGGH